MKLIKSEKWSIHLHKKRFGFGYKFKFLCLFIPKHHTILDKIKWCRSLQSHSTRPLTRAIADHINHGVLDTHGTPVATPHLVYVDDDIYLNITNITQFE